MHKHIDAAHKIRRLHEMYFLASFYFQSFVVVHAAHITLCRIYDLFFLALLWTHFTSAKVSLVFMAVFLVDSV